MGNRLTENKKRSDAAWKLAYHCPDCTRDEESAVILCDAHRCVGITRKGTRCQNSATFPDERACAVHLEGQRDRQ